RRRGVGLRRCRPREPARGRVERQHRARLRPGQRRPTPRPHGGDRRGQRGRDRRAAHGERVQRQQGEGLRRAFLPARPRPRRTHRHGALCRARGRPHRERVPRQHGQTLGRAQRRRAARLARTLELCELGLSLGVGDRERIWRLTWNCRQQRAHLGRGDGRLDARAGR
ncbi:F-box/WD repeat-containing protein 7, partial [Hondaea fermentalgiana]